MSFLPEFDDDIFISYAHIDDRPLTEGQKGWISSFHQALETRLAQLLVPEPNVWRDLKLRGNDRFEDKLIGRIPKIAVLVSVISPRYVNSEWCIREMREFYRVEQQSKARIEDMSRIFKVIKTFVPPDSQPPEIQGLLGYEFYQVEKQTGRARELNPEVDPDAVRSYWRKLDDLAYDIHQLLENLKRTHDDPEKLKSSSPAATVYLAETTFDLRDERDSIRRELHQRGYTVLPDAPLPSNAADFDSVVSDYLKRSRLSIHLIGENYGDILRDETTSHVFLQNELAAKQTGTPGFSRLIWMPVDLKGRDPRQREFIDYLQRNSTAQQGAELLQTTIEELKQVIQDKLSTSRETVSTTTTTTQDSSPTHVYIVCDRDDAAAVAPLSNFLYDLGYEPVLPSFEGSETDLREMHKENLLWCDACLIYYGSSTDFWLRSKLRDLQKIAGYGRTKPMLAKCVYVGPDETPEKRDFRTHDATVIKNFGEFTSASLAPFLAQFVQTQRAGGGQK